MVGVINTLAGLSLIYGSKYFLGAGDAIANVAGYTAGLILSFVLNSSWTFDYRGSRWRALARFVAAFAVSWLANLAVVMPAIHLLGINSYLAHLAGMPVYTVCFYVLSRWYVFRHAR